MPKQPVLYEAMYIVDSALDDAAIQQIAGTLEEHVRSMGGEVIATREFGRRRLAFEIEGHRTGTYQIMYFKSHGNVVDEVRHEMHLTDGIVRGIVVLANPKAIFEPQPAEAPAPAEAAPEDAAAAAEPDMALAEATTPEVSVGEAVAESEGAAEAEAESVAEAAEEAAPEAEAEAGEAAEAAEPAGEEA